MVKIISDLNFFFQFKSMIKIFVIAFPYFVILFIFFTQLIAEVMPSPAAERIVPVIDLEMKKKAEKAEKTKRVIIYYYYYASSCISLHCSFIEI